MFNVLIVDDDASKAREIASLLCSIAGFPQDAVSLVTNVHDAKEKLTSIQYDLLILDMLLPLGISDHPIPDAGIKLLDDLLNRERYLIPTHIVRITAYGDLMQSAGADFANRLLTLLHYDITSDDWKVKLAERTRHMLAAQEARTARLVDFDYDLAVVCALQTPELDALLRLPWRWEQHYQPGDDTIYHRGYVDIGVHQYKVISAAALRMGMPATTSLATKMIYEFRPRFLAMVGIAAGVEGKSNYGDILAATMAFDHGSGKLRREIDGKLQFLPSTHQANVSNAIGSKIRAFQADTSIFDQIRRDWFAEPIPHILSIHTGPIASGASVHTDGTTIKDILGRQRDLIGLDMETYGVLVAGTDASKPRPEVIVMKSVVDYADGRKTDRYQNYAAYTSAQALRYFVEKFLFNARHPAE